MNMSTAIQVSDVENNTEKLWEMFKATPFGMSDYQIRQFVLSHLSDSRNQRQVLLELSTRARSLTEGKCFCARSVVELRRLNRSKKKKEIELNKATGDKVAELQDDIEMIDIDIHEKTFNLKAQEKYVADALRECKVLLEFLGKITLVKDREEFERAEHPYWIKRATNDAKLEALAGSMPSKGTLELLQNLKLDLPKLIVELLEGVRVENEQLVIEHRKQLQLQSGQE